MYTSKCSRPYNALICFSKNVQKKHGKSQNRNHRVFKHGTVIMRQCCYYLIKQEITVTIEMSNHFHMKNSNYRPTRKATYVDKTENVQHKQDGEMAEKIPCRLSHVRLRGGEKRATATTMIPNMISVLCLVIFMIDIS